MGVTNIRRVGRLKRKNRIRAKVAGTPARPRLCVFRSAKHIYAQVIDDLDGQTLAAASTVEPDIVKKDDFENKVAKATFVGKLIAERAKAKGIERVVFDRGGYLYHGRVKALSEGAREGGLIF